MTTPRLITLAAVIVAIAPFWLVSAQDSQVVQIPDEISVPLDLESKAALMQGKLTASSSVLDGLVNGDFELIKESAEDLERISLVAPRAYTDVAQLSQGEHLRKEFIRLSGQLKKMANDRNLEGAAYVHQNITATCIACHAQLRERNLPPEVRE